MNLSTALYLATSYRLRVNIRPNHVVCFNGQFCSMTFADEGKAIKQSQIIATIKETLDLVVANNKQIGEPK